jgi:hypothetical protein
VVASPEAYAPVTSPISVHGTAPASWFFENQFPVRLESVHGDVIAEAPAHPRTNWTEPGPKVFDVELSFDVVEETGAILVLEEDMPGEGEEPRRVLLPITLLPTS